MTMNGHRISKETWHRFVRYVHGFRTSKAGPRAMRLAGLLLALLLSNNSLNVLNSYVGRDFISAIEARDTLLFVGKAWLYIGVFAISTVAAVMTRYAEESLGLVWREWQTRQMINAYLKDRAFYQIEESDAVENPDQRIAEDVRAFTATSLSFALMSLNGILTVLAFSGVLWSISPRLFVGAVLYAGIGTGLTVLLGKRLVGLNDKQLDKEANFRSELIHVREHAEPLALLNREAPLRARLTDRLDDLVTNARRMISVNRNLGFFTTGYNYVIQIMPALIVAPLFIQGKVPFGVITQSAMAFSALMGAFSLIVTQFQSISNYAAVITRLGRLGEALDTVCGTSCSPVHVEDSKDQVEFKHLTLYDEKKEVLVADLNLVIPYGTRTLVRSSSGHAKAALFKAAAGLNCLGAGNIKRPSGRAMMFMPERPYLPRANLRMMLAPAGSATFTDEQILGILRQLHLEGVVTQAGGLGTVQEWSTVVALNDQAMLAVARLMLAAPQFVFMDRLSIAFDLRQASQVLRLLTERGISYIVLGKADDVPTQFDNVLDLGPKGTWRWRPAAEVREEIAARDAG